MNRNIIPLLLALALGTAGAQTIPNAGTAITNQAQADFRYTDPITGTESSSTSLSNVVTTTVTAVPSYTVTPNATSDAPQSQTVNAGSPATFTYTVTNTGNTPLQITLASENQTGDSGNLEAPTLSQTTVTLQPGESQQVTATYTAPGNVREGTYNQNLVATADSDRNGDGTFEDTNIVDDNNYNQVVVYKVQEPTPTSPTLTNPTEFPSDPDNAGTTPVAGDEGTSTGPGYTADGPSDGTTDTPVNVDAAGNQVAYPPADDGNNGPDVVTLTSGVTNQGPNPDVLTIGPASDPDGSGPVTVQLINPATGAPFQSGDRVVDANGNSIDGVTTVVNGDGTVSFVAGTPGTPPTPDANGDYPGIPADTSPAYQVQITYPDSEGATGQTPDYTTTVPVTSQNANGQQVGDTSFTVKAPNPDLDITGTSTINPTTTAPVPANVPVTVTNNGQYTEAYDLTGSSTVPGSTVTYFLADANGNPIGDSITSVGPLAPGETVNVIAQVSVPANTPADSYDLTSTATGQYSGAVATDTATDAVNVGVVTNPGTTVTDPNDPNYTSNALFPVSKRADVADVAPGGTIVYTITGTNLYNTSVYNVVLRDPANGTGSTATNAFTYANLTNATATGGTGTPIFSDCGANRSETLATVLAAINAADAICISFPGSVAQNGTVSATLTFTVPQTPGQQQ